MYPLYKYNDKVVLAKDDYLLVRDLAESSVFRLTPSIISHYNEGHQLYIVDSVYSGTGRSNELDVYQKLIKPLFLELGIDHKYVSTSSADTISEFAGSLNGSVCTVLFISGDTSVNEFINSLLETKEGTVNVGIIPLGTGNSIALSLGITNVFVALERFFQSIELKKTVPFYTYEASFPRGSYFIHQNVKTHTIENPVRFLVVLSWAFHAALVADSDTPELRKHGVSRFRMAAENNLKLNTFYNGSYSVGGETYNGPFAYWLVTATSRFEEKFLILPKGNILHPDLYLVLFGAQEDNSGKYIMDVMEQVYLEGSHLANPDVEYKQIDSTSQLKLSVDSPDQRLCLDGAIVKVPEPGSISVKVLGNEIGKWKLYIIT